MTGRILKFIIVVIFGERVEIFGDGGMKKDFYS